MYTRLLEFTERFEILCYNQFAFRKNLALIDLINKISSSIDQREITAGVFWTSKAFDTINHDISFHKFERYQLWHPWGRVGMD
jgi:hypothetical protein